MIRANYGLLEGRQLPRRHSGHLSHIYTAAHSFEMNPSSVMRAHFRLQLRVLKEDPLRLAPTTQALETEN